MSPTTHRVDWRNRREVEAKREAIRQTLSDQQVRDIVSRVRQEQREKATMRWFVAVWVLSAVVLGWLAFTSSGQAALRWMDGF
jgi:hypothetical protein